MLLCLPAAADPADDSRDIAQYPLHEVGSGAVLTLDAQRGQWTALHFLLAVDCPYCTLHTMSYAMQAAEFPEVRHVFIKPTSREAARRWAEHLTDEPFDGAPGLEPPPIHCDPQGDLARRLAIPNGYEYLGESMHCPAFVLFNPGGEEVFRYTGENTSDRFRFDQFAELIRSIHRPFRLEEMNLPEIGMVAVGGNDPVAYFTGGEAVEGDPEIAEVYHGIIVRFSSEEHREIFRADPLRYLPAYGGWCAMNMTTGRKRQVDLNSFRVHDGRLFLFNRGAFTNARTIWERDIARHIAEADASWEHIGGTNPPTSIQHLEYPARQRKSRD